MKPSTTIVSLVITVLISGCAHPIKVEPDATKIYSANITPSKHSANVGYYIPADLLALEVTTPGGGGDNVRYYPYRDIESGYRQVLDNVFTGVVKLPSPPDLSRAKQQGLDYIIQPQIVTSSGSTGFFTWPPTNFTVDLTSNVRDSSGKIVANPRVVGVGTADSERLFDHGFAGRRAMEDALLKAQTALSELDLTPHEIPIPIDRAETSTEKRLITLQDLKNKGLLTKDEYEKKKQEILKSL
ncbi:SHOCT domain-containing protein [Ectopseudomonas alcaliphila]|uniref:SHOCT domain-containing protein n=1 Tax=Ectopseudomonas alcaliphila TaxID=101564 RepID=UPI002789CC56|nr:MULTISPECIES: SHOCT domain-containing protein [Pseudomonas]MDP9940865.1 hypothetical protein [Pseudomonas sp. 3400]MDR7013084.1 hypothetical protein [Pseudomonas alcaliphila]